MSNGDAYHFFGITSAVRSWIDQQCHFLFHVFFNITIKSIGDIFHFSTVVPVQGRALSTAQTIWPDDGNSCPIWMNLYWSQHSDIQFLSCDASVVDIAVFCLLIGSVRASWNNRSIGWAWSSGKIFSRILDVCVDYTVCSVKCHKQVSYSLNK